MLHDPDKGPLFAPARYCRIPCYSHDPGLTLGPIEICLEWSTIPAWRRLPRCDNEYNIAPNSAFAAGIRRGTTQGTIARGRPAVALWVATLGFGLSRALRRVLARARQPFWAGTSAAIVCQPHLGASLRKGWFRMIGTVVGAVAIVVLTAAFPQDRALFLVGLALWGAACALRRHAAAQLRGLRGGAGRLHGGDHRQRPARRRPAARTVRPSCSRSPAPARSGSASCAPASSSPGPISAARGGGWPRCSPPCRQKSPDRFAGTLAQAGSDLPQTQPVRRELVRRVIALDPTIDEALGESSHLRYHSPVLQSAVEGLLRCSGRLAHGRGCVLRSLPDDAARQQADAVLLSLRSSSGQRRYQASRHAGWPIPSACAGSVRPRCGRCSPCRPRTPSRRLLADQTAKVLAGLCQALDGLALLVADPARPTLRRRGVRLRVPDWLPALVNAGRAFVDDRRGRALLDRDRMAERRLGHHLHGDCRHPVRAESRPGLRRPP